ncbi:MAG: hypothetical protein K9H64_15865 [Bacteroidales bacterium]|nr:hypothetical protein [Bacteroidales bacterium]MCF8457445.1 hypothetical protein [Bacteroidales bacterium]
MRLLKSSAVYLAMFAGLFAILSCEKEAANYPLGNLVGKVSLIDLEYNNDFDDNSGILVTIDNSDYIMGAETNIYGDFKFSNIQTGSYNIVFQKKDHCPFKIFGYQFVGGEVPASIENIMLYEYPKVDVNISEISIDNSNRIIIHGDLEWENSEYCPPYFRIYFGYSTDVSYTNYKLTNKQTGVYEGTLQLIIENNPNYFPSGTELFAVVYPCHGTSKITSYMEPSTGCIVYPSINQVGSNTVSLIIP